MTLLTTATACGVRQPSTNVPYGGPGSLYIFVVDSAGTPRRAVNAYLAEDLRVTSEVVTLGRAGAWTDSTGVARLGAWRPGNYTLVVRALGFVQQQRSVPVRAGATDTLRIVVKTQHIQLEQVRAQSCLGVDTRSSEMIATVKRIVTGTTQGSAQTRAMLHLPGLTASQVTLVADDSSCVRARQAKDSIIHATNPRAPAEIPARGLYVIKLGDYNAVSDPGSRTEGSIMLGFYDPAWIYLGSIPIHMGRPSS